MDKRKNRKNVIYIVTALLIFVLCVTLTACGKENVIYSPEQIEIDYDTSRVIEFEIEMESGAKIGGDLYPLNAPLTVRNFIKLCEEGHYDGTSFDYVIADKIIMCSGKDEDDPPYTIYGEFSKNNYLNTLPHYKGTFSMMHQPDDYDSAYSKFFVILENRDKYNGEYATFARVTSGFANIEAISKVDVDGTSPVMPQTIKSIRILGSID